MKETFTIEEIKAFLEKAAGGCKMDVDGDGSTIAIELDKAWNRGVNSMYNKALLEMYIAAEVEK